RRACGLKETNGTEAVCPGSVSTTSPLPLSHTLTVLSSLEASRAPSGLKHTHVFPLSVSCCSPLPLSQTFTPSPAQASRLPSGLKHTSPTSPPAASSSTLTISSPLPLP